jgi:uncharacterized protein YnzC (UPF0291/DUF896 family)
MKDLKLFLDVFFMKKSKEINFKVFKKKTVDFSTGLKEKQQVLREAYLTFIKGEFLTVGVSNNQITIQYLPLEELVVKFIYIDF